MQKRLRLAGIMLAAIALAYFAYSEFHNYQMGRRLVRTDPDAIVTDAALIAFANQTGEAAFASNCASCHGAGMKGNQKSGVPNLTDDIWLYDFGRVSDIERTVLYGIRSGLGKSHNVTDMPGIGREKALDAEEIKDVIAFTLSLSNRSQDTAAIERGGKIFQDKGVCYDCHSREGTGISDYGAPNLTDDDWLYGGDEKSIYTSIYDGRHGLCPAWFGKLSLSTIRALAVYIHSNSKESSESRNNNSESEPASGQSG